MDTDNQTPDEQSGGDTYITYQVDLENVESLLQENEETLEAIGQKLDEVNQDQINSIGVIGALFGFLIGFFVFKELLKVWLE